MRKVLFLIAVFTVGSVSAFAQYVTLDDYAGKSRIPVNYSNAETLIERVNELLDNVGAASVVVTGAARNEGDADLHPKSRGIDLRWNASLYERIKNSISGSGLRLECSECIRKLGQADHIHLDIGKNDYDTGRFFHATSH